MTLGLFTPYHSAIEIDGSEYAYYGHPFHFSGVMFGIPNKVSMMLAYRKIYGYTFLSNRDIERRAHSLAFNGSDYNLLNFNCNTFADAFLYALTKHHLPSWINRPERCLRRIRCMRQLFNENEDISGRIVTALYIKSAGDQNAVFNLLGIGISRIYPKPIHVYSLFVANDERLTTIYEVMLQDSVSSGKIPNFEYLRQSSDLQIRDHLIYLHNNFLSTFPTKQSITLNKIFDDLSSLQHQLNRLKTRYEMSSMAK
jgi:hypothetical protein